MLGGTALRAFQSPYSLEEQRVRHWSAVRETSGNFIVEQDCHGLDVLNWFAEAHPMKATGAGGSKKRAYGDNLDHLNVTFEYPGGLRGFLGATQLGVKRYWDVEEQFFGTEGILETERQYYKWHRAENNDVYGLRCSRQHVNFTLGCLAIEIGITETGVLYSRFRYRRPA